MDFVNKQYIIVAKVGQNCCQISLTFNRRSAGNADVDIKLIGNNVGQCSFAQTRRSEQQHVVQRFVAGSGSLNENRQIILDLRLTYIFI